MNQKFLTTFCGFIITISLLSACVPLVALEGKKPITDGKTKIVRGYNPTSPCQATIIGSGNRPPVGPNENLTNLSVSCSDNKNVTWKQLRQPLPNTHACVATLHLLRDQRKEVTIVSDPTDDNPYRCILDNITPKQFISGSKWQN